MPAQDRMNILFIISDQHTPSVTGCYGNDVVHTPNIDRLSEAGVTFDSAYCNAPVCVPSRMSMLSGLHSDRIGVWHNADPLPPHVTTWPMLLSLAGYETMISGRMHLLWGDRMGGFSRRLCGDTNRQIPKAWPSARRDSTNGAIARFQGYDTTLGEGAVYPQDEEARDRAIQYLREEKEGPFALCVGFYKPHAPFKTPKKYLDLYGDLERIGTLDEPCIPLYQHVLEEGLGERGPLDPDRVHLARQCYYGMVTQVDEYVGEILNALEDEGLSENTIVIYTSDHGDMLGRHQLWHKVNFYEDSVRVPMVFSCPSRFAGGMRRPENVSLLDLFPTFLDIAGNRRPCPLDGESLMPLLQDGSLARGDEVIALSIGARQGHPAIMLKRGSLKLICTMGYPPVLFDLEKGPQELVDFSEDPTYASTMRDMLASVEARWDPDLVNRQVAFNESHLANCHAWQEMRELATAH